MLNCRKSFTLVEMLVALAVSSIIIIASYASYDLVATQYRKNIDIADMHTSGRAIMRIIERDIRMAGFEYRDKDAKVTYGSISSPLTIKDSGNKCCDEVTVVYDYAQDLLSWKGKLISSKVDRIRIRYWAEPYTSNKGSRYRLYKQKDILGQNKKILPNPKLGKKKEVMADYIEDFQLTKNDKFDGKLYIGGENTTRLIALNPDTMKKVSEHTMLIRFGSIAFHDGKLYIGGENTTRLIVLNPDTMKKVSEHTLPIRFGDMAFHDGKLYIGGENTTRLIALNPDTMKKVSEHTMLIRFGSIAFHDGKLYIGGENTTRLIVLNPDTMKKVSEHTLPIRFGDMAFHDGKLYIGGENTTRLIVLNPDTMKKVSEHTLPIRFGDMTFSVNTSGKIPMTALVSINLTLRTKNQYGKDKQFKKKDYHAGNYKLDKTDKYKRDNFSSTVLVRNLAL